MVAFVGSPRIRSRSDQCCTAPTQPPGADSEYLHACISLPHCAGTKLAPQALIYPHVATPSCVHAMYSLNSLQDRHRRIPPWQYCRKGSRLDTSKTLTSQVVTTVHFFNVVHSTIAGAVLTDPYYAEFRVASSMLDLFGRAVCLFDSPALDRLPPERPLAGVSRM